jgi:hypothetical protein
MLHVMTHTQTSLYLYRFAHHYRYWWLRVQVLGELGEWAELEKLSKSKKSPIGYEVSKLIHLLT